jgi:hypothetical protein
MLTFRMITTQHFHIAKYEGGKESVYVCGSSQALVFKAALGTFTAPGDQIELEALRQQIQETTNDSSGENLQSKSPTDS